MKKTAKLLAVSAIALGVASVSADASESSRKRASVFENVFSVPSSKQVKRERRAKPASAQARRGVGKWQDNIQSSGRADEPQLRSRERKDDVRVINGQNGRAAKKPRNVISAAEADPEGDPGLGMGNIAYVAPKLVALTGAKLAETRPADAAAALVYDALATPDPALRVMPEVRDAVLDHYRQQNFRPLWVENGTLSPRGAAVLKVLADADSEGLEAAAYLPPALGAFDQLPPAYDAAAMARLDVELSVAALNYARDASGGRFDPRRLSLYHDVTPETVSATQAIKVLAWSPYPVEYLKGLHPAHPAYAAMKAELARLRLSESAGIADPIPDGDIVKKGGIDSRIPMVRQRLADLGHPAALDAAGDPELLDAELAIQIRLFQKASNIRVTGILGPQTVAALNTNHSTRDIARLVTNMERVRWMPRDLGQRHVFVNQPAYEAWVMDKGEEVWRTRVIVGKALTQTNVFHDVMETVVFNPSWGVPQSIIAKEYLPKLRRDPGYLDRIGFKVVNASGKTVPSRSVSWASYGSKVPFGVLQPPGDDNALGEIKFMFPNTHNIYMHDTPSRDLFEKDERAYSHGCVRVQNPREFASVLLGWSMEEVASHIGTPDSETVRFEQKIPVHLTYFTAWPDETGKIRYFNDIYGRDKTMENARSSIVVAGN